jgi:nitrate/nitrite-specific signal transduction histidine kinase
MAIKIKTWLEQFFNTFSETASPQPTHIIEAHEALNDVAFAIATSDEINKTLPPLLNVVEAQLNQQFNGPEQCHVNVLFSSPSTSETFVHHPSDSTPSPEMLHSLHRYFTNGHNDLINDACYLDALVEHPFPDPLYGYKLTESNEMNIWLLITFPHKVPCANQVRWKCTAVETLLKKGFTAWAQQEKKISKAIASERAIHAAELHDSLAQVLGYLRIKSAKLDSLCQSNAYHELKPVTEDLAAYTHYAYRQTRELITSSRLSMKGDNLTQAILDSVSEFEQQSAIVFEYDNRLKKNITNPQQSMQLLYIVRECLNNIVRHSHASHARIVIKEALPSHIEIYVEDNGIGLDAKKARNDSFGLKIMHERAERIDATLIIQPHPNKGTQVILRLPVGDHHE